jgi:thymidylate synthase ThyX
MIIKKREVLNSLKASQKARKEIRKICNKVFQVEQSFYSHLFEKNDFSFDEILTAHNSFLNDIEEINNVYFTVDKEYLNKLAL